uniref:Eukaryotic membrane protein, putative n=2 Tax=Babesia bovis TaxID=5865 RepID=A7AU13_BABBO|eukprot:XP_001609992.1 eukaryotic membrane protein [Babesia bovis T2Bo]
MAAFFTNLADFICVEIQGYPFIIREHPPPSVLAQHNVNRSSDGVVNGASSSHDGICDDEILDPIDAIPENSLKHMLRLPRHFERIMLLSLGICIDSLLFELTMMPIQAVSGVLYIFEKFIEKVRCSIEPYVSRLRSSVMVPSFLTRYFLTVSPMSMSTSSGNETASTVKPSDSGPVDKSTTISTEPIKEDDSHSASKLDPVYESEADCLSHSGGELTSPDENDETSSSGGEYEDADPPLDTTTDSSANTPDDADESYVITPIEACGFARFAAMLFAIIILSRIDTSRVYHNIRGQPFFKLYVIFNMLEICERLCRSFGRDCIDTLMRTTVKIYKLCSNFSLRSSNALAMLNATKRMKSGIAMDHFMTKKYKSSVVISNFARVEQMATPTMRRVTVDVAGYSERTISQSETTHPYSNAGTSDLSDKERPIKTLSFVGDDLDLHLNHSEDSPEKHSFVLKDLSATLDTIADTVCPDSTRELEDSGNAYLEFILRFLLVTIYIIFHSFMHLLRVLILNIAINSSDSAMFLLMVTNNFAEIKSTVFKKFNETSLFTIVATDAIERFHLCFDGMIVFFKMCTVQSPWQAYLQVSRWLSKMLVLEVLIDYFKHSFLLKFNKIGGELFKRYTEVLIGDILLSRSLRNLHMLVRFDFRVICKGVYSFSHIPARRLGFMSSPIMTLIVCNIPYIRSRLTVTRFVTALLIWTALFFLKVTLSILLLSYGIKKRRDLLMLRTPMDAVGSL